MASPVRLNAWEWAVDVDKFAETSLAQLAAAVAGGRKAGWQHGHWTVRELVARLRTVGVHVEVSHGA